MKKFEGKKIIFFGLDLHLQAKFFKVEIHLSILQRKKKNQFEEETEMEKKKKSLI